MALNSAARELLPSLLAQGPFQPATQFWRAIELAALGEYAAAELGTATRVLDLGCGDGGVMALLRPAFAPAAIITGIDIDPRETALAARRGMYAAVETVSSVELPFADASFDLVFSNSVLEHITFIDETLTELARVLRPGGAFVATVPGPDFHAALAGPASGDRQAYLARLDRRVAHLRYWNAEEWRHNLARAGIALNLAQPYMDMGAVRRWESISRATGGMLYDLCGGGAPPLELQRRFGLRRRGTLPAMLAKPYAALVAANLPAENVAPYGCLLLRGTRI